MLPILVTTSHRGVFFGYVPEMPAGIPAEVVLVDARNCVFWSTAERGVFGLAVMGPSDRCRIGPKVPELRVNAVTAIARCTPEAAQRWEAGPWS
jgi:hypothetical protein